jgi:hypothetical protein
MSASDRPPDFTEQELILLARLARFGLKELEAWLSADEYLALQSIQQRLHEQIYTLKGTQE